MQGTYTKEIRHLPGAGSYESILARINQIPVDTFEPHVFDGPTPPQLVYRLLRPAAAATGKLYPLVVVLHGAGEMGTDNQKQVDRFVKTWAQEDRRASFPSFVLAPQMPLRSANYDLPIPDPARRSRPGPPMEPLLALIDSIVSANPIDPARVYVLGFSMGGSTTWNAIALRPERFAAAVIFGAVPTGLPIPPNLPPLWLVHGCLDQLNPIGPTRTVYEEFHARQMPVRFWEYDDLGHWIPDDLQVSSEVPRWLFSHSR